jgi:glycosyltransferase involved in cell wall biosynthesis
LVVADFDFVSVELVDRRIQRLRMGLEQGMTPPKKTDRTVELSVIVASINSRTDLRNCLESILANKQKGIEIIVADCSLKDKVAKWINEFPMVKFIEFSEETSLAVLIGTGIAQAKGGIITITDSACLVAEDWISSILLAHKATDSPVIGGSVEMNENGSLTDWAAYFCDYSEFMPPAPCGVVSVVPGNNLSIKREILQSGAEFVEPEFWKTLWCRRLQSEGIELISEPAILVSWRKAYKLLPFLVRRFNQGRCFAGMRFAKVTFFKRVFYAAGSVFLPVVFFCRTAAPVFLRGRSFGKFFLSLPITLLAIVLWSIGETFGFLAGTGTSCGRID